MKLNSTVAFTLILLACMSAIGTVSGALGYSFGRSALKGVTQPAISPILGGTISSGGRENTGFLKEAEILRRVKEQTSGGAKAADTPKNSPTSKSESQANRDRDQPFPIQTEDQGVSLAIQSVQRQEDALRLDVTMENQGSESVQFLYTFLDITDEQGRSLTAITKGLPTELKPDGETVKGTISLPLASLENVKQLSLSLTDYPNQELRLKLSKIPVNP